MKGMQKYLIIVVISLATIALVERIEPLKKIIKGS